MRLKPSPNPIRLLFLNNFRHLLVFMVPCLLLIVGFAYARISIGHATLLRQEAVYAQKAAGQMNAQFSGTALSVRQLVGTGKLRALSRRTDMTLSAELIRDIGDIQQQIALIQARYACVSTIILHLSVPDFFIAPGSARAKKSQDLLNLNQQQILRLEEAGAANGWHLCDGGWYYYHEIKYSGIPYGSILAYAGHSNIATAMNNFLMDSQRRMVIVSAGSVLEDSWEQAFGERLEMLYPAYKNGESELVAAGSLMSSVVRVPSDLPNSEYLLIATQKQYGDQMRSALWLMGGVCALLLLLLVLLLYLIARALCKPYEVILALLQKPELLSTREYNQKYRSLDQLGMISVLIHQKNYQYMATKNELNEKARMLREAQNAMLQAQMNPHFLFNTLDSIHWMAQGDLPENNRVSDTICLLSKLLRISLQSTSPLATVAQEMEHARLYLEIQRLRMDHPVQIAWQVDEQLMGCDMLCLSLQPLLENAIQHGIRRMQDGQIDIRIQRHGDNILVAVTDNGTGLSAAQLEALRDDLSAFPLLREKHIGLANIKARLLLIYDNKAALRIESTAGVHTRVEMEYPASTPP